MGNTPNVRFKGFTEDWEQRKLGELLDFHNGFNGSADRYGTGIPLISVMDILNNDFITSENIRAKAELNEIEFERFKVEYGDVLFQRSSENIEDAGTSNVYMDKDKRAAFGGFVICGKKKTDYNPLFMKYGMTSKKVRIQIMSKAQGAQHINVSQNTLQGINFFMPSQDEQDKIGAYFSNLDNLITLHQQKCDETKELKKYMLQNMFPQKDEKVLKIRFDGFTGDWEQRKLGELAEIVGGGTPSTSVESYWDGDIDWYAPAEIGEQIYLKSSQRKITEEGLNKSSAKVLPVGTVLFTSRAGIGKTAILLKEGCTNQGFQSIVPNKDKLDSYFIFTRSEELKRYGETVGAGSTFVEVSGKQMANMELMMPTTMDEQQQIGEYFQSLDHLITLHQQKCNALKEFKKYMLQNMFPQKGENKCQN